MFGSYLQSQATFPEMVRERHPLAITISREVGAGENHRRLLGQRLTDAETPASPWIVFDSSLAKQVLEDHNLPPNLEQFMTEDAQLLPVEAIVEEVSWASSVGLDVGPARDADHPSSGWLRRCHPGRAPSQHHHRPPPDVFHVRLVSPLATRIRHTAAYYHLSEAEAAKLVREQDQARRRYVRRYLDSEIDDPSLYDVTLNTGRLGFARTAEAVAQMASQHRQALVRNSADRPVPPFIRITHPSFGDWPKQLSGRSPPLSPSPP